MAKKKPVKISCKPTDLDNESLRFGKYKGSTPNEVAKVDPGYLCWMFETVKDPPMTRELYLACELEKREGYDNESDLELGQDSFW